MILRDNILIRAKDSLHAAFFTNYTHLILAGDRGTLRSTVSTSVRLSQLSEVVNLKVTLVAGD